MLSISLGPLAFPVAPLPVLAALLLAAWTAHRAGRAATAPEGTAARAESAVWAAAVAGLIAARGVHLALHADAYADSPWATLDIRDGGWHAAAGWAVAAAVLAWRAARALPLRPALGRAAAVALLVGLGGQAALQLAGGGPAGTAAPGVPLLALPSPAALPARAAPAAQASGVSGADLADPAAAPARAASATLADLVRGQPSVVNLWATWCAPCRAEMPMLAAAQQRHADVRFLFVNQGEDAARVNRYLQREALPLRDVWLDADSALGTAVQSRGLPTTLFYDRQGRLVDAHMGLLNAAALRARLQSLRSD